MIEESLLPVNAIEVKERRKSSYHKAEIPEPIQINEPIMELEEEKELGVDLPMIPDQGMNMFDESNINVGELMLYHEKEDNSAIFSFHRQVD